MTKGLKPALPARRALLFAGIAAAALLVLDRVTKVGALAALSSQEIDFVPGLLGFRLVFNEGASFGMLQGATGLFLVITVAICALIIVYLVRYRRHTLVEVIALGALVGGALGNAWDRLAFGRVTDFIELEFIDFPVFNVADCGITLGVIVWIVFVVFSPNSPFREEDPRCDAESR